MKLSVKERFYDKKESIYVEKKAVIERDDERAQELIKTGVAVELKEEKPKKEPKKKAEETPAE